MGLLEGALARNGRHLRFAPPLEAAYEQDGCHARTWRHIVCNVLGLASFCLLSPFRLTDAGDAGPLLEGLRLAVIAAAACLCAVLWCFCRGGRPALREWATTLATLMVGSYAIVAAHYVSDLRALMHGSGLLLIFLHVGIAARLQFRFAVTVNLAVWLGYAAFSRPGPPGTELVLQNHVMLFGVVLLFSTVGNCLLELRERRNYLLECLGAKHHAALLADAEALRELTVRDGLTGVYNRRHLDTEMARLCAADRDSAVPVGLLHVDVDHFKRYNDRYGHPAGDRCLAQIAAALDAVARRHGGLAARIGGEEFAVLLPGHAADRTEAIGNEVGAAVRALALPHADSSAGSHASVSVGAAASTPGPGVWASTLIGAADAALYAAKRQGRDRCVRFDASITPVATSPRVRPSTETLAPGNHEAADELAAIERLSGVLGRGLRWLRFPADLEFVYQERHAPERRRQLAFLTTVGLAMMISYIALCRPVMPDIADAFVRDMVAMALPTLAVLAINLKLPFGWKIREGIVSATILVFGLAIVWIESHSRVQTVYSVTLALCLLPIYGSLVIALPLRFSLAPSLAICIGVATLMPPERPEWRGNWLLMLCVLCAATLYSLIGAYLLELAERRAYLLDRLRQAQLAVLRGNTEHLQRLASVDPLTRLPNRRHFETELDRLAAACSQTHRPLALLIVDIDHFKPYNDGYGHPAGDACLQRLGAALGDWVRSGAAQASGAVPARLGGEEFGVLLPGVDAEAALAIAERLRQAMHELRIEHGHSPVGRFLTISVGVASRVLGSAADARLLLQAADAALYRAKALGRDRAAA